MQRVIRCNTWKEAESLQRRIHAWYQTNVQNARGNAWAHPMYDSSNDRWAIPTASDVEAALTESERGRITDVESSIYKTWVEHLDEPTHIEDSESPVIQIVALFSRQLAEAVGRNPSLLDQIEWRDLERILAEVCSALGFDVELTPSSKDGGRDIVIRVAGKAGLETYYVEIKHWRSGKKVGDREVGAFFRVIVRDKAAGGVLLSTSGFGEIQVEANTEISSAELRLGRRQKVVSMCETFLRVKGGLWHRPLLVTELLFDGTESAWENSPVRKLDHFVQKRGAEKGDRG